MRKHNVIGPSVRRIRLGARLSIEELSLCMSRSGSRLEPEDIERIEAGVRPVMDRDILHFSRALGVGIDALFSSPRRK